MDTIDQIPDDHDRFDTLWRTTNLSRSQLLLLLGQQKSPSSVALNMPIAVTLRGELNIAYFRKAFQLCVDQCDALRTVLQFENGIAHQTVQPEKLVDIELIDLSASANPSDAAKKLTRERSRTPFELKQQLFDTALIKICEQEHLWFFNQHHLITDATSTRNIFRRLSDTYQRLQAGDSSLPPPPPQFANYRAEESRRKLEMPSAASQYWRQFGKTAPSPPRLYGVSTRIDSPDAVRVTHRLSRADSQRLRDLVARPRLQSFTPHASLFNLFATWLFIWQFRVSRQSQLAIGTLIRNRTSVESEETVGPFTELFPLCLHVIDDDSPAALIQRLRAASIELIEHAHPGSGHPEALHCFNVVLNYTAVSFGNFANLATRCHWLHSGHNNLGHHLTVSVQDFDAADEFVLHFDFNCQIFDPDLRQRSVDHLQKILNEIIANPDSSVADIDFLGDAEKIRLAPPSNVPLSSSPKANSLLSDFSAVCQSHPTRLAVQGPSVIRSGVTSLNYRDLDRRSNQLGCLLQSRGAKADQVVALYLEPTVEWMIAMLAVAKTGAAYASISVDDPRGRVEQLLDEIQPVIVLTHSRLRDRLRPTTAMILADHEPALIQQPHPKQVTFQITGAESGYLIATSGSTGKPKVVSGTLLGVRNLLNEMEARASLVDSAHVLWWTSSTFDVSVYEVWHSLAYGRTLHIVPHEMRPDTKGVIRLLTERRIHSAYLPAFMLTEFAEALESQGNAMFSLQRLLVGVEPIPEAILLRLKAALPKLRIINGYGPAETTICCTLYSVPDSGSGQQITPIGTPVKNVSCHVLDSIGKPTPIGTPGELHVGGIGLAHGYWKQAGLTTDHFVFLHHANRPKERVYRTGDLVRFLPSGDLQFLGRIDDQLKIRGHRIEPGEVASVLKSHEAIREAAVIGWPAVQPKHLIAYVSLQPTAATRTEDLRHYLTTQLPVHSCPSHIIILDRLPLNSNDKVDRSQLPPPSFEANKDSPFPQEACQARDPVKDPLQRSLLAIWRQVFDREQIDVRDNFFELGGDSIVAFQIAAKAADAGLNITPQQLFSHHSILEMAATLSTNIRQEPIADATVGPIPLTPVQLAFFDFALSDPHHWNQSIIIEVNETTTKLDIDGAFHLLAQQHQSLRMSFVRKDNQWSAVILDQPVFPPCLEVNRQQLPDIESTMRSDFDLAAGKLISFALITAPDEAKRLLIVWHHLVTDAISWSILLSDLNSHLKRRTQSASSDVAVSKRQPFGSWANGLSSAAAEFDQNTRDFWLHPGASPASIPRDFNSNENTEASADTVSHRFSREETELLEKLHSGLRQRQTQASVLAAVVATLKQWTRDDDVVLELEGHGREELIPSHDFSRTIGWFTSRFPLYLRLATKTDVSSIRTTVIEALNALPHRGASYGLLRHLHPDGALRTELSDLPQPELLFNYLGRIEQFSGGFPIDRTLKLHRGAGNFRPQVIEVDASIFQDRLCLNWTYSHHLHRRETLERQLCYCVNALLELLTKSPTEQTSPEPTDYPYANLDRKKLGKLTNALSKLK